MGEQTLYMQFVTELGSLYTISLPAPDHSRSTFVADVNTAMDAVIEKQAIRSPSGGFLVEKKRAWWQDVEETEIPLT